MDYSGNDVVLDTFQGKESSSDLIQQSKSGIFIGRRWGKWRGLFHYNFHTQLKGKDSSKTNGQFISKKEEYEGRGFGITMSHFLGKYSCLNLSLFQTQYDDYSMNGIKSSQQKSTNIYEINLGLSFYFGKQHVRR